MWGAIVMHGALMLTLGPLGLGHEWGVFLWNVYFGVQAWLLFRGTPPEPNVDHRTLTTSGVTRSRTWFARTSAWIVCLLPALSARRLLGLVAQLGRLLVATGDRAPPWRRSLFTEPASVAAGRGNRETGGNKMDCGYRQVVV